MKFRNKNTGHTLITDNKDSIGLMLSSPVYEVVTETETPVTEASAAEEPKAPKAPKTSKAKSSKSTSK